MSIAEAFGDFAEMLAEVAPAKIAALEAPAAMSIRLEELINKKKNNELTLDEHTELERYLFLDSIITLAKDRAKTILAAEANKTRMKIDY